MIQKKISGTEKMASKRRRSAITRIQEDPVDVTDRVPDKVNNKRPRIEPFNKFLNVTIVNQTDPGIYLHLDHNYGHDYVTVGHYVYRVNYVDWIDVNAIGLNVIQQQDLRKFIFKNKVMVSNFESHRIDYIDELKLRITLFNSVRYYLKLNYQDISDHIIAILADHIVHVNQEILIPHGDDLLIVTVLEADTNQMGRVTWTSQIDIQAETSDIVIYKQVIKIPGDRVYATIGRLERTEASIDPNYGPMILDKDELGRKIHRRLTAKKFVDNKDITLYLAGEKHLQVTIKVDPTLSETNRETNYVYLYELEGSEPIHLNSTCKKVILTSGSEMATKVQLNVTECKIVNGPSSDSSLIHAGSLIDQIKSTMLLLTQGYTFSLPVMGTDGVMRKMTYKVASILPHSSDKKAYCLNEETKIRLNLDKQNKSVHLYDNLVPVPLHDVTFKVKKARSSGKSPLSIFASADDDVKELVVDHGKLEKQLRQVFPKLTTIKNRINLTYQGEDLVIKVIGMKFETDVKTKYNRLGEITSDTTFTFKVSEKDKSVTLNKTIDASADPVAEMEKYVGGLSDQLKTIVRTLLLSRGKLKVEFEKRGIKPARGMILYGPPGNGKTTLARNIGKIFGCEGDRFKLISGPEVFNKWVGSSEKNVRKLFEPAKEAWKKYGNESPLYMIVIDEIDAMLPARGQSSGNPVRDSVVNQFLAELDGLVQFDNLICIGLTNRLELLDSAVTRPGRLGTHIEIGMPSKEGRKKIFAIHSRKLQETERLDNVSLDDLARETDGFSGAEIESVIERASSYSLERLSELKDTDAEVIAKVGKVTMTDLTKAIGEIRAAGKEKGPYMPMYM
jgi:ATP-dependent 26S proteasome regulatory subunit